MVRATCSSCIPAYGVGASNAVGIVDETSDLEFVAGETPIAVLSRGSVGSAARVACRESRLIPLEFANLVREVGSQVSEQKLVLRWVESGFSKEAVACLRHSRERTLDRFVLPRPVPSASNVNAHRSDTR